MGFAHFLYNPVVLGFHVVLCRGVTDLTAQVHGLIPPNVTPSRRTMASRLTDAAQHAKQSGGAQPH